MNRIQDALTAAIASFAMPYPASEIVRVEICPVKKSEEVNGMVRCEVCDPQDCDFYGVYARYRNGEAHIIRDLMRPEDMTVLFSFIQIFGV